MIVSGGENVYSAEVEQALYQHAAVAECAVIGVPDAKWGEAVHAVVRLKPGIEASEEALIAHCHALHRRLQGAALGQLPRGAAAAVGRRQDSENGVAPAVLAGQGPRGELSGLSVARQSGRGGSDARRARGIAPSRRGRRDRRRRRRRVRVRRRRATGVSALGGQGDPGAAAGRERRGGSIRPHATRNWRSPAPPIPASPAHVALAPGCSPRRAWTRRRWPAARIGRWAPRPRGRWRARGAEPTALAQQLLRQACGLPVPRLRAGAAGRGLRDGRSMACSAR